MYYNHNLRTSLQEWKNRLYRATYDQFGHQLKYCLSNIESNKLLFSLLNYGIINYPYTEEQLNAIIDSLDYGRQGLSFDNETHHASHCYQVIKQFIKTTNSFNLHTFMAFQGKTFEDTKKNIIEEYITPIFHYFHDNLEKSSSVIYLLEKYKKRTEWFTSPELLNRYLTADKNYEQIFEDDLRLFLFDQGIDYPFSTPKSTSGRVDIIGAVDTTDPLIVEIKIFDRKKNYGKKRIVEGFSQIIKYTNDYNKDVGYLVIFNIDNAEIDFVLQDKNNMFPPMITLNNKVYFLITINLHLGIPASKIGSTEIISINESELIR